MVERASRCRTCGQLVPDPQFRHRRSRPVPCARLAESTQGGSAHMADEQWDVVVVGSGPGGLTAAACLAASRTTGAGARGARPGGRQHPGVPPPPPQRRRRHRGVRVRRRACTTSATADRAGCSPPSSPGWAWASGSASARSTPTVSTRWSSRTSSSSCPADWDRYRDRLVEAFPAERAGIERVVDTLRTVADEGRSRVIPGVETPTFDRWAFRPLSRVVRRGRAVAAMPGGARPLVRALRGQSVADRGGHARVDHRPLHAGRLLPRGRRPDDARPTHPGDRGVRRRGPHADAPVEREHRRARIDGRPAWCSPTERRSTPSLVISNADHRRTVFDLVGAEHWDPATVRWTEEADHDPRARVRVPRRRPGPERRAQHQLLRVPELRDRPPLRGHWTRATSGDATSCSPTSRWRRARTPTTSTCAPSGQTNLQIMTLAPTGPRLVGRRSLADRGRHLPPQRGVPGAQGAGHRGADRRCRRRVRRRARRREPARPHGARRDGHAAVPGALHPLHRRDELRLRPLARAVGHEPAPAPHRDRRPVAGGRQHRIGSRHRRARWSAACTAPGRSSTGRCWSR